MEKIPLTLEFGYAEVFFFVNIVMNNFYFSGGMELLFRNSKKIEISVPKPSNGQPLRIRELLPFIRDEVKPDRPELFMQEETM